MSTLQDVARRVVWFDSPEQTLSNPPLFLAHLMVYGTLEEVLAVGLAVPGGSPALPLI